MRRFKILACVFVLLILTISCGMPVKERVHITTEQNVLSIRGGDGVLSCYRYEDVPFKPCVQQLFSPAGVNVLRDSPADHKHHHALMFAVAADGVNFWEEQKEPGQQVHRRFVEVKTARRGGIPYGGFVERLDWMNPRTEELLLEESRRIEVSSVKDFDVTVLSWQSSLSAPAAKESVTLSGSHYFGLGMRFVQSMDANGRFRNSEGGAGEVVRGDERVTPAKWCAYTAQADGHLVTIAMFGHPDNVRGPTLWFTMTKPFAYLSATLNLYREPLKIARGNPLCLRYAVGVWDGQVEDSQIEQVYSWWVQNN
ncbi:MAG TPA: DUF6807 family protein [Sedimentisphaerales bacterium]|nr:DUF6807 family protein [Sedimentisphaerales bacterium]